MDPYGKQNLARDPNYRDQLAELRGYLTSDSKAQQRPFGEFVPGEDSVPVENIQPYLDRMKTLRPVRKGFVEVDNIPAKPKAESGDPASRAERRKARLKRKEERRKTTTEELTQE